MRRSNKESYNALFGVDIPKKLKNYTYSKLIINETEYPYHVRFSRRARYLQLRINSLNQLELVIPRRYSLKDGEKFLHERIDWIKKYQHKISQKKEEYFFFGERINISESFNLFSKHYKIKLVSNTLFIESPSNSKHKTEEIFNIFLRKKAKEYLEKRTRELAVKYGFNFRRITIRGQKTRWGSCSSKGSLSFNYRLIKHKKEVIDYVIIHELCHLKEMNHSQKFWNLVAGICPEYRALRRELK